MKKIFSIPLLMSVLAVMVAPMLALAQVASSCTMKHDLSSFDSVCTKGATVTDCSAAGCGAGQTKAWGMCCILDALYTATDWIFIVLIVVVGLLIIWGGVSIATAAGAPEKVTAGRNLILYALIGLAVALLSKALPSVVKALLGV